jgi:hypothetical protein
MSKYKFTKKYLNKLYNMNCDNKFSKCCGCPGIGNMPREFTNWSSSKLYNLETMKKAKITNSNDYRALLQANAESIMKNTVSDFDTNYKCKNSGNDVFYLDSSNYNSYYDKINNIKTPTTSEVIHNNTNIPKGVPVEILTDNMTLSSISFAPFVSRSNGFS